MFFIDTLIRHCAMQCFEYKRRKIVKRVVRQRSGQRSYSYTKTLIIQLLRVKHLHKYCKGFEKIIIMIVAIILLDKTLLLQAVYKVFMVSHLVTSGEC